MTDQPTPAVSESATPPTGDHVWKLQETGGLWCGNVKAGCTLSWPDWLYGGKPNCPATPPAADARYAEAVARVESSGPKPGRCACGLDSPLLHVDSEGRHVHAPADDKPPCSGEEGFCDAHGFHRHAPTPDADEQARADAYYRQMTAPPPPGALEAIRERLHSDNPQRRAVHMNAPAPDTGLREEYAAAIWERNNPGRRWADCEYRWRSDAEADADAVVAVRDRATQQLRDRLDSARASRKRWMNGYQAAAEQRAGWIRRVEQAEATIARVRAECDRIEAAVRANPTNPDFDGAYLAAIGHIRAALDQQEVDR